MFNQIIELIKNSVITVVGLAVGVLGAGNSGALSLPDATLQTATMEENTVEKPATLFGNADIFSSQLATISEALQSVVVVEEGGGGEATALTSDQIIPVTATTPTTEYFDRADVKEAVFLRPATVLTSTNEVTQIQETESIRPLNPIKSTKQAKPVDMSLILNTDFDNFDANLQIVEITEDDNNFYVVYQFRSFAIKNKVWEEIIKEKNIIVVKAILGNDDLRAYLSEELSEVLDSEIVFLKEVQEIQRAKIIIEDKLVTELSQPEKPRQVASDYSGLIGKVLNINDESFDGYTSVKKTEITPIISQKTQVDIVQTPVAEKIAPVTNTDNEAPVIVIQGNNPALIQIGSSFMDLGARVVDNVSDNLGVKIGGDIVNTSVKGSYFITYTATDEAGNTAQATREVIVYDYGVVPEVQKVEVEEIITPKNPVAEIATEITKAPKEKIVKKSESVAEEIIVTDDVADTSEKVATTTEIIQAEEIATTTEKAETGVSVMKTMSGVVDGVAQAVNKTINTVVGQTGNTIVQTVETAGVAVDIATAQIGDVASAVAEVVDGAVETTAEQVTKTLEDVSAAVEVVAEEVSAMIRAVNIMELLGNIRSALQSSVVTAGEGTSDVLSGVGQFIFGTVNAAGQVIGTTVENVTIMSAKIIKQGGQRTVEVLEKTAEKTHQTINQVVNKSGDIIKKIWRKTGVGEVVSEIAGQSVANISDYMKEKNLLGEDKKDDFEYQEQSFVSFAVAKTIALAGRAVESGVEVASSITANVRDFAHTVSSDLKDVGEEIDEKIDETDFNPQGFFTGILNFFKNHRPL